MLYPGKKIKAVEDNKYYAARKCWRKSIHLPFKSMFLLLKSGYINLADCESNKTKYSQLYCKGQLVSYIKKFGTPLTFKTNLIAFILLYTSNSPLLINLYKQTFNTSFNAQNTQILKSSQILKQEQAQVQEH